MLFMVLSILAINPTNALVTGNTLTIAGSSTVYPVARDAAASTKFPTYFNGLNLGYTINTVTVGSSSSNDAVPSVFSTSSITADIGEMSRPPTSTEWAGSSSYDTTNMQLYAVGIDSVAIIIGNGLKSNSFLQQMTATQIAKLFVKDPTTGQPFYTTWNQVDSSLPNQPITRVVRDTGSGTYDCFQNYFLNPSGYAGSDKGKSELATYQGEQTNDDVETFMTSSSGDYAIAFISMGYLTHGGMTSVAVKFEHAAAPYNTQYVTPTKAHVIDGSYSAWRWLWQVTTPMSSTNAQDLARGVFIAYCKLPNTVTSTTNFVDQEGYINLERADMTGGIPLTDTLTQATVRTGQTQTFPDKVVDGNDFFYFVDSYIHFYSTHTYNPYADIDANGVIDGSDFLGFMSSYVHYYQSYNPTI